MVLERQEQQAQRHQLWLAEGHLEWPTQIDTVLKPHQVARFQWLKDQCVGTVLEVGCSWGFVLAYVGGQCGIDQNPESIEIAKRLARGREFHVADARNLPFLSGQFDTVMLADVLEHLHIRDASIAIREALRVARKRVLVTMPMGDDNTEDATNMKHQWLCDRQVMEGLFDMERWKLAPYSGFYCLRFDHG